MIATDDKANIVNLPVGANFTKDKNMEPKAAEIPQRAIFFELFIYKTPLINYICKLIGNTKQRFLKICFTKNYN